MPKLWRRKFNFGRKPFRTGNNLGWNVAGIWLEWGEWTMAIADLKLCCQILQKSLNQKLGSWTVILNNEKIDWSQDIRMLTSVFYCNNNDINIEQRKNTNLFGWETKIIFFYFAEKIWKKFHEDSLDKKFKIVWSIFVGWCKGFLENVREI